LTRQPESVLSIVGVVLFIQACPAFHIFFLFFLVKTIFYFSMEAKCD
jgi:hypothetical protein